MTAGLFYSRFGSLEGTRLVTAPGRVNLIGEHTDYNLLPVFPVALQRNVRIHFHPRADGNVRLAAESGFEDREFALSAQIAPYPPGDWGNYAKAAAQALVARWGIRRGFDGVVSGDLPMSAGLSSSSALVVAASLALLDANGLPADRIELAELLARGEHYVGTEGGGMDQAICLGGRLGHAVLIEFAPLRLQPVPVPSGWRFLIAHSMVTASKSAEARQHYNRCVHDSRAAAAKMGDYRDLIGDAGALSRAEKLLEPALVPRFRHQITEGRRVYDARQAMLEDNPRRFGELMLASHVSLRDDYEVSCPEVDRLVEVCMLAGALGARVTGAGFGGFVVALAGEAAVDEIERRFYAPRGMSGVEAGHLFRVEPSNGASVANYS